MIRGWMAAGALAVFLAACGPAPTPKCQSSNCSGCCTEEGTCLGSSKQSFNACGSGGGKCRTCLPQQACQSQKCVDVGSGGGDGSGGGGSSSVGGGSGGGGGSSVGGGNGGGTGGGVACGSAGQACCVGMGSGCLLGLSCVGNTCTSGSAGGGTGGGGTAGGAGGGTAGGAGGGTGGGTAGGGGAGGGAALGAIGDPCFVGANCATNFCQAFGFMDGYCTKTCMTNGDCPGGSVCGRNPGGGNVCLKSCGTAGTTAGCRTGYVCEKFQSSLDGSPVCFPACTNPASCTGALNCDTRGFCCGVAGSACCAGFACDPGNSCNTATGYCQTLPVSNRPNGEACTSNPQCAGNICQPEVNMAPNCAPNCFAGGFCTQDCTTATCAAGSSCSPYTLQGVKRCAPHCTWDGGRGDCRQDYVCDRMLVAGTQATCFKKCFADAGCNASTKCDSNGFCCGAPFYRCCSGAVKCPNGGTCNALDYCQ